MRQKQDRILICIQEQVEFRYRSPYETEAALRCETNSAGMPRDAADLRSIYEPTRSVPPFVENHTVGRSVGGKPISRRSVEPIPPRIPADRFDRRGRHARR